MQFKGKYRKRKEVMDFWLKIATDLNGGLSPKEIAGRYINPHTGKPYSRVHIYWVIRQLKTRIV